MHFLDLLGLFPLTEQVYPFNTKLGSSRSTEELPDELSLFRKCISPPTA